MATEHTQAAARSEDPQGLHDLPFGSAAEAAGAVFAAAESRQSAATDARSHWPSVTRALIRRLIATIAHLEDRAEVAEEASLVDPLTRLANRRAWRLALSEADERIRRGADPAIVVVVDLDELKHHNDTHGHVAGDALLRRMGATLVGCMRVADVVSRIGGDEFAVLAVQTEGLDRVIERVRNALSLAGIAASVGAAAMPEDGTLHDAWELADFAMYADKARRRGARHESSL